MSEAVFLSSEVEKSAVEKQSAIKAIKIELDQARKAAQQAQSEAEAIKAMTKDQLTIIARLITEDARSEGTKSFVYGVVSSFPIGILASFLASHLYTRFRARS